MSRRLPSWAPFLLFLVPLLPLWRPVFLGEAIGPWGAVNAMVPGWHHGDVSNWNILNADGCLQFYAWRDLVFRAWGSGQMPFWNPYQLCGTPLLANSQSAAFYPLHILAGVLHIPTALALTLLAWFHLGWTGLGCFSLVRRLGGTDAGGLLAGACATLSPFMLAWTVLPSVITTVSWMPWVWSAFLETSLRRRVAYTGLALGMMVLGGHLQFAFYGIIGLLALATSLAIRDKSLPALGTAVAAVALGLCVASPQLLPTLSYSHFSHRATTASAEGFGHYAAGAPQAFELLGLAAPGLLGQATGIDLEEAGESGTRVKGFWPALVKPGENYAESAMWLGPAILLMIAGVKWKDRPAGAMLLGPLAGLGLLMALGTVANMPFYFLIPGFASTASPGRAACLFVLGACCLAGCALPSGTDAKAKPILPVGILVGIFVLSVVAIQSLGGSLAPWMPVNLSASVGQAVVDGLPVALAATVAACAGYYVAATRNVLIGAAIMLVGQVVATGVGQIPSGPPPQPVTQATDLGMRVAFVNKPWDFLRFQPALMPPNLASITLQYDVAGYDSLLHRDTVNWLKEVDGEDPAPPINGNMMFIKPKFDPAKLAEGGVTEVWSRTSLPQMEKPSRVDAEKGYLLYPLAGPGRVSGPKPGASITQDGFAGQTVKAEGPGTLTVRDRMMDGWSASVDGKPTLMASGLWRNVDLPKGRHTVRFVYSPPGLQAGLGLGALGLLAVAVLTGGRKKISQEAE